MTDGMTDAERDALWTCNVCRRWHVIPDLARHCERSHHPETHQPFDEEA